MLKFEETKVYNLLDAIRGMRNSWESWEEIDTKEVYNPETKQIEWEMGPNDKKLCMNLAKAGPDHGKFLRQILISVDIIGPLKWWDETDQYSFFTTNSTSSIHTLGKGKITVDNFSFEDLDDDLKEGYMGILCEAQRRWIESGKKKPSREWRQMLFLTAMGFNYKRTFTSNYSQLRTMYFQRKNHRLSEWREDFTAWIHSLPYHELITVQKGK